MHLKVRINESDPRPFWRSCQEYIPSRAGGVRQADRSNYRPGIFAGGFTRGSSLIVPVGSRVSTFFARAFGLRLAGLRLARLRLAGGALRLGGRRVHRLQIGGEHRCGLRAAGVVRAQVIREREADPPLGEAARALVTLHAARREQLRPGLVAVEIFLRARERRQAEHAEHGTERQRVDDCPHHQERPPTRYYRRCWPNLRQGCDAFSEFPPVVRG